MNIFDDDEDYRWHYEQGEKEEELMEKRERKRKYDKHCAVLDCQEEGSTFFTGVEYLDESISGAGFGATLCIKHIQEHVLKGIQNIKKLELTRLD